MINIASKINYEKILGAALLMAAFSVFADQESIKRGAYLTYAAGCITCHTEQSDDAMSLAGGRAMKTPFGMFYTPNITPDNETGIGAWSDDDFVRALQLGVSPTGAHYFPSFPYASYTGIAREDLLAIKAYLFSLAPVNKEVGEHNLDWFIPSGLAAWGWKALNFTPARFQPDSRKDGSWNRGAYLVRHLGHCGECHTERNAIGALRRETELGGSNFGGEIVPNITPHPVDGIGRWSENDIEYFLEIGMLPDGDFTGSSMADVIDDNTSHLTRKDRLAIAVYLKSIPESQSSSQ